MKIRYSDSVEWGPGCTDRAGDGDVPVVVSVSNRARLVEALKSAFAVEECCGRCGGHADNGGCYPCPECG